MAVKIQFIKSPSSGTMDDHKRHNAGETQRLLNYVGLAIPPVEGGN